MRTNKIMSKIIKYTCKKCLKEYSEFQIKRFQAGSHTAYICPNCHGPCNDVDVLNEKNIAKIRSFPSIGKLLLFALLLYIVLLVGLVFSNYVAEENNKQEPLYEFYFENHNEKIPSLRISGNY